MTTWFHSTIIATSLAACVAVGFASASIYSGAQTNTSSKTDRLNVVVDPSFHTVETRTDGMSVLTRMPTQDMN